MLLKSMIKNLSNFPDDRAVCCDVLIVGSGAAGVTVALELEGQGKSVILLESGLVDYDQESNLLNEGYINNELPPIPLDTSRLRMLGGTTNHWAGNCVAFDSIDFDVRPWIKNSGWPIKYDELKGFYRIARDILQLPKTMQMTSTVQRNLIDVNNTGSELLNIQVVRKPLSFGEAYKSKLEKSKTTTVFLDATATYLHMSDQFKAVKTVEVRSSSGNHLTVMPKAVVLATGGVENARLLLSNGFGEKNKNIGAFFSFHPRIKIGELFLKEPIKDENDPYHWTAARPDHKHVLTLSERSQKIYELPNHALILESNDVPIESLGNSALRRLRSRVKGDLPFDEIGTDLIDFLVNIGDVSRGIWRSNDGQITSYAMTCYLDQIPCEESRIILSDKRDRFGVRKPEIFWNYDDSEIRKLRLFSETVARQIVASGKGRVVLNEDAFQQKGFLNGIKISSGGGHQIGTTRMSETRLDGVVDRNCQLFGTENLFCLGSSTFATGSWANPTLTIVALSARLADFIGRNWVNLAGVNKNCE